MQITKLPIDPKLSYLLFDICLDDWLDLPVSFEIAALRKTFYLEFGANQYHLLNVQSCRPVNERIM